MRSPKVPCIAVVGTGTGVGKTAVAALLVTALRELNVDVAAAKPLASGCRRVRGRVLSDDALALARALGHGGVHLAAAHDQISPWRALAPLAPALALSHPPSLAQLVAHIEERARGRAALVVEAAGGLLLPFARDGTVLDWLMALRSRRALDLRVLLVGASALGTINHTCLSIAVLRAARLKPAAVVLSRTRRTLTPDQRRNGAWIARLARVTPPLEIPFLEGAANTARARRVARAIARQLVAGA